ncbi:MAG: hypothetical protein WC370_03660 [Dehalococcoidales bacterium]|jgi:hypothetical protein
MVTTLQIDDSVMNELKKKAVELGMVFNTPNEVLKVILGVKQKDNTIIDKYVDIEIKSLSTSQRWHLIPVPKRIRRFFPGYKLPFLVETDMGEIKTHISSAPKGTHIGDPDKGVYIQSRLKNWFDVHKNQLETGTILRIQTIEPGKRYKLDIK